MPTNVLSNADTTAGAGAFNKPITIEQLTAGTPDGMGGRGEPVWQTVINTWAHISPWKGAEQWQTQQVYPQAFVQMLIRYRTDVNITPVMRVRYGQRIYNIRAVRVPSEAQTTIELLCEELQTHGSLH